MLFGKRKCFASLGTQLDLQLVFQRCLRPRLLCPLTPRVRPRAPQRPIYGVDFRRRRPSSSSSRSSSSSSSYLRSMGAACWASYLGPAAWNETTVGMTTVPESRAARLLATRDVASTGELGAAGFLRVLTSAGSFAGFGGARIRRGGGLGGTRRRGEWLAAHPLVCVLPGDSG